ncbi:MAG TPA: TspO/MBR family protein [Acetobacteraceae bacterium]|nr:TspO/MBR family protein [Acetobacteraceae bacterium]
MALVGFVGLALLVGAADGALASGAARAWYLSLARPPGAAPEAAFGPIWAALYICCGFGGWLAWRQAGAGRALRLWGWQLFATAARAAAFFGLRNPALALGVGVAILVLLILVIRRFWAIHRGAAWLMVPSLLWTGYCLYLDAGILVLTPA